MDRIRVGIAGTGGRGIHAFMKLLRDNYPDRAQIVALMDTNEIRLEAARNYFGRDVRTFTDYADFLDQKDMEAVFLCTPDFTHARMSVEALKAGKHLLCEKPMATTPADLRKVMKAAENSDRVFAVGLVLRYADFMKALIPVLRRGDIGDIVLGTVVETLEGSSHFARWHRKKEFTGGILVQKSVHTLDLLGWMINEKPVAVFGTGGRDVFLPREDCRGRRCLTCPEKAACPEYRSVGDDFAKEFFLNAEKSDGYILDRCVFDPEADIVDNAALTIEYENGRRGNYALSLFADRDRRFTLLGTKGHAEVSREAEEFTIHRRKSGDTVHYKLEGHGEGLYGEIEDFLGCVRTGRKPLADGEAGFWGTLTALAGEKSIETGERVRLDELL